MLRILRAGVAVLIALFATGFGMGNSFGTRAAVVQTADEADTALQAALQLLNAVPEATCTNHTPPVGAVYCLSQTSFSSGGLATFNACFDPGVQCRFVVLGREESGDWNVWFNDGAYSSLIASLPVQGLVCAYGGLVLRSAPFIDADRLAVLPDRSNVSLDQFLLTAPATAGGTFGRGWYHVTAPEAGWVSARFLLAAGSPSCQAANPAG